ncbi:hypothetical protein J1N35_007669 [Gossypium stocksii]|uniref:Uncharacterized protein n=1 Tax=Gossypium stocksii TaxID=47602 RepID=A0A9D3W6Z3_9ROSI|nr:hypothetical protein J1N35_007669 [Gossypium stocksii]
MDHFLLARIWFVGSLQLGRILLGCDEETTCFFYHYSGIKLCPFGLPRFIQEKEGRGSVNLLIAPTNHRVAAGQGVTKVATIIQASSPIVIDEDTPSLVPWSSLTPTAEELPTEIIEDPFSWLEDLDAQELSHLCVFHYSRVEVVCGPFDAGKVDFDVLDGMDMSSLGFDVYNPYRVL